MYNYRVCVVGTTGIEPVTPTMSTQCVDGYYNKIPGNRTPNAHFRSRLSHGNDGHFLGLEGGGHPRKDGPNSRAEEADHYDSVVARLNRNWRVIVCSARIQWVLQRRRGQRRGRARWEGRSYCRTKEAITRLSRRFARPIDPVAAAIMAALPDCIGNITINSSEDPATATPGVASHLRETPPEPIRGRNT